MRRFELHRQEDLTGISGTGVVAQGIEFDDGTCALRWLTACSSTAMYAAMRDIEKIHGHEGRTQVVYLDRAPTIRVKFVPESRPEWRRPLSRRQLILDRLEGP